MVPLDRLIPHIFAAGYTGFFDLELIDPHIAAEGAHSALARAMQKLDALIGQRGKSME